MASLVERFNHGAFSFIGEKFVALDREQVVDLFRNRAIGGIKRCQRIGRPGLLARDGGVGRRGRGTLWRGRSFARFRCCLARRRSNRQYSCTRRGRSFSCLSRRLTRCCHPSGFRQCSRRCCRCARVLRNGPDRCCKDQRQGRARQDALVTGVAHSAILPIPEYSQARPSSISACRNPDAKLARIRACSNSLRGNLDDFGALSLFDIPSCSVFLEGCNRIATHGPRMRGIAASDTTANA